MLIGPNNCGKSAVVAALDTLCNNPIGDYMVRHNEKDSHVIIETDDGPVVTWQRKRGTVGYIIDGHEISHLRGQLPEDLHQKLRFGKVDPGDNQEKFRPEQLESCVHHGKNI